jgi:hypothetical protein
MSMALFLRYVEENGPSTSSEVARELGITTRHAAANAQRLLKASKLHGQRVHVVGWVYDEPGQHRYPRALYAAGPGPNVPRPKVNLRARYQREYRARLFRAVRSVWDLALSPRNRVTVRARPEPKA